MWRFAATGSRRSVRSAPRQPHRNASSTHAGLVVAPGFIDMHSHSDMTLLEDGGAQSKIRQGVTTEILGEDTSAGPAKGKRPPADCVKHGGSTLTWTTLGGYFDALEAQGIAVNVASYVGLGHAAGMRARRLARPARSAEQIEAMKELLDEAMRDGAIGLSTMLASPRELAVTTDDLVVLCQVVKRHGGIYSSHIRNEGTEVFAAVKEAIAIGRRGDIPVDIIHLKIADQSLWGRMREIVASDRRGQARGRQRPGERLSLHARQQRPGQHHPALGSRRGQRPS